MLSLDLVRLLISLPFFIYASYTDWKERLISTGVWFFLGIISFALLLYQFHSYVEILAIIPAVILFYEWFVEWKNKIYSYAFISLALIIFFIAVFLAIEKGVYGITPLFVMTVLLILFRALYAAKIIRGRADARALMSIAILQPVYPRHIFSVFPLWVPRYVELVEITFPFAFLVLLYTGIIFALFLLSLGIRNLIKGHTGFPEMFMGYMLPLEEVNRHHVWLMERVVNGEHVLYLNPSEHTDEDIKALKKIGRTEVWVQPKIPFVVFITAGLLLAYLLGNFL